MEGDPKTPAFPEKTSTPMTPDTICLKEADIIRLIQAYLGFRGLHLSLDTLERETGIINSQYPEEALVLRTLIMDGRWRDVLHFIARLPLGEEDLKFMTFEIMKQKYVELICVYEELGNELYDDLGNAIALCFSELSTYCPCPVEYENLRKLASLTKLSQDAQYKDWNPISSRRQCFQTVCSVLLEMQGIDGGFTEELIDPNRLPDLLVKGILYESCEEYCESKASAQSESTAFRFGGLIRDIDSKSSDLNLYSWLQSVPWVTMSHAFLNQSLTVKVDHLEQPGTKFSWTEKILQNCTDLPEDIASELRRPVSSTEDLKEIFWNRRIEDNLIVDAPQILKRAEEVISRWERRNSTGRNSTGNGNSIDKSYGDIRQMPGCEGDSEEVLKEGSKNKTEKDITRSTLEVRNEHEMVSEIGNCEEGTSDLAPSVLSLELSSSVKKQQLNDTDSNIISKSHIVENMSIVDSVFHNEQDQPFDDKQNIRDLLEAKDKVRSKLLQILKNSAQDRDQRSSVDELNNSPVNLQDPVTERKVNREEVSKEVHHPFFIQPHLLREEESKVQRIQSMFKPVQQGIIDYASSSAKNEEEVSREVQHPFFIQPHLLREEESSIQIIQRMFKPVPEGISYNASSSAKIEKDRKQQNIRSTSHVDTKKNSQNRHQLSTRDTNNRKRESLSSTTRTPGSSESSEPKHNFVAVTQLEDEQAIRSVEFHPSGKFYAVGSNTKALRICAYPNCKDIRSDQEPREPTVLYKRQKHHKGSIYCMAWNGTGDLLATGSNDKTVKLMRFNSATCQLEDIAHPLTMHGGTVRDMCFMEDLSNRSNLLISGGSGDNKIYITDCETAMPFQSLSGHTGQILSIYTWGGVMFVTSSQDKSIRFWDMRTRGCVHHIPAKSVGGTGPSSAAATISVDPSGRLLVSGHEDSSCMLYDMKGNRILQNFKPHTADVRTARLSPKAFYLLTGSYDCKLMLTDLQGDLTQPLATVRVAEHADKVIQGRWHPKEFTFISTSADKTATLWGLPQT